MNLTDRRRELLRAIDAGAVARYSDVGPRHTVRHLRDHGPGWQSIGAKRRYQDVTGRVAELYKAGLIDLTDTPGGEFGGRRWALMPDRDMGAMLRAAFGDGVQLVAMLRERANS